MDHYHCEKFVVFDWKDLDGKMVKVSVVDDLTEKIRTVFLTDDCGRHYILESKHQPAVSKAR